MDGTEDDMLNDTEDENRNCNAKVSDINDEPIADVYNDVIKFFRTVWKF